jgi:dsDNA-specific endonuclease/ATPase MutS2
MEWKSDLTAQAVQEKQPLKDLFEQVKKELEGARQDLDTARQQTENQRLWIEKERDLVAKLVSDLSGKRQELVEAVEAVKRDQEATETLRKQIEEAASEATKTVGAVFKEFQSAWEVFGEKKKELIVTRERIQDAHKDLNTKRSQLRDLVTQIHKTTPSKPPPSLLRQCPSCGRGIGPSDLYCDICGTLTV